MEIERAGLLVLSIAFAVMLIYMAYTMVPQHREISGTRIHVLNEINSYASECMSMNRNGNCFVIDSNTESSISPDDIKKLSPYFIPHGSIPEGKHKIKFSKVGNTVEISVVQ